MEMFYCHLLTTWLFVDDSAEKQMFNTISLVIEQRKNEFDRIAKVRFFPIYFYTLQRWYHFPDTCRDLFFILKSQFWNIYVKKIAEGVIDQF
jgi:hypothetical protein